MTYYHFCNLQYILSFIAIQYILRMNVFSEVKFYPYKKKYLFTKTFFLSYVTKIYILKEQKSFCEKYFLALNNTDDIE